MKRASTKRMAMIAAVMATAMLCGGTVAQSQNSTDPVAKGGHGNSWYMELPRIFDFFDSHMRQQ